MMMTLFYTILGWILITLYGLAIVALLFTPLRKNRPDETAQSRSWGLLIGIAGLVFALHATVGR